MFEVIGSKCRVVFIVFCFVLVGFLVLVVFCFLGVFLVMFVLLLGENVGFLLDSDMVLLYFFC